MGDPIRVSDNDFEVTDPDCDNDWDGSDWTEYLDGDSDGD